jgi:hypothetical protein
MAELLSGAPVAAAILAEAKRKVDALRERGIHPTLALVRVGEDPASVVYLRKKGEACAAAGIRSQDHVFPETMEREVLLEFISDSASGFVQQKYLRFGMQESADGDLLLVSARKFHDRLHCIATPHAQTFNPHCRFPSLLRAVENSQS